MLVNSVSQDQVAHIIIYMYNVHVRAPVNGIHCSYLDIYEKFHLQMYES